MQAPVGDKYIMGNPCDPNLIAFAAHQAALLGYPKSLYPSVLHAQLPQLLLPSQALLQQPVNQSTSLSIPDMDKAALEEPIEAGSLNYRKRSVKSVNDTTENEKISTSATTTSATASSTAVIARRHSAHWETMTDDERELIQRQKRKEEAFKTALCDSYKRTGNCPYGQTCRFAHGENELRMPLQPRGKAHPKYKTQLCDKFSSFGQCPYGPRCQFIHKLKKGLPLLEYERAVASGDISPAREDEITNPDDSDMSINVNKYRRRSGEITESSTKNTRRNLATHLENVPDDRKKVIYPPMQVVNIEMATRQAKGGRKSFSSMISQEDYQAAMASGKMFSKPENIRTYSAMIRANEECFDKPNWKQESQNKKNELSLICEENTIMEHTQSTYSEIQSKSVSNENSAVPTTSPWYEKIFGKTMTVIKEESTGDESSLMNDMTTNGVASDECISNSMDDRDYH